MILPCGYNLRTMTLGSGTKLGPYEIVALIGAGGMGEVYRARDARLGREVAIKVLSESFTRDPERLRRFEQEARAVAALNHPNILGLYDIGSQNGSPYLVSELLEGDSLREMLRGGPASSRKAGDYAVQIASGLAAAHEKGIVHRDLKPENLFITKDGRAKILDFGLAKLTQAAASAPGSEGLTVTSSPTMAGVVMGTAGYMSPEQVRGEAVDHRTDIFAFGAVLYEMISGQLAFHRDTAAETMTAILKEDPAELADTTKLVSPALDRIVRRCLEKRPEQRFQSAQDLAFALGTLTGTDTSGAARTRPQPRSPRPWLWATAALVLLLLAAILWLALRPGPTARRMQFALPVPGQVSQVALSPDGEMLAFVSPDEKTDVPMIYVQRVGTPTATELPGTEGACFPFWSPDDAYVGYFAKGKLLKISASGGSAQTLAKVSIARGGSWGSKNVIVYTPDPQGGMWRVNADGTGAEPLSATLLGKGEQSQRWPVFLADGDHFLFWSGNFMNSGGDTTSGIYESSLESKQKTLVVPAHSNVAVARGQVFYADERRRLVSSTFDTAKGTVSGESHVTAESVGYQPAIIWGAFSAAANGNLIYSTSTQTTLSALIWVDREGKELGRVGDPGTLSNPTLSPDGKSVAVDVADTKANRVDVWLESLQAGSNTRFTFDSAETVAAAWSRDQKSIAYRTVGDRVNLMLKSASGLEQEKKLATIEIGADLVPNSWSADDKQLLCTEFFPDHLGDHSTGLALVPATGGDAVPFGPTKASQRNGQISPDGKWVAYASNESGEWEVYVTTFPAAAGKWQISRGGGSEPRWRGDGKELFYIGPTGMMIAATVSSEGIFSSGTPVPLFQVRGRAPVSSTDSFTYDVSRDGKRFLVNRYLQPDHPNPLTIVLNATAEQK